MGSLSLPTGRHKINLGAVGRLHRTTIFFPGVPAGTYSFDYNTTSELPWSGGGDAMAGLMIGAGGPGNWGDYDMDYAPATTNWDIRRFIQGNRAATDQPAPEIRKGFGPGPARTEPLNTG